MSDIRIALLQSDLQWENPKANLKMFEKKINGINENVDIVVLPEVFTTGFTMEPMGVAEPFKGDTFRWMEKTARERNIVLVGSKPVQENGKFYNRLIWMQPDGNYYKYDKRHLFSFAGETKNYSPGKERVIVEYKGWKFLLIICYDLRFPVWCKNNYNSEYGLEYDCIINIANWPAPRRHVWDILLKARAIENQSYMVGVNRIGEDGNGVKHRGDSAVICPKGEVLSTLKPDEEKTDIVNMSRKTLDEFRSKFRVWEDWDNFKIVL